jgi:mannose-6-phosphate isomerase-like protein (cupin superfamily)
MSRTAAIVDQDAAETVEVLGPTIAFLTPTDGPSGSPCILRGTIPAGAVVPLHSHGDPETFLVESGGAEALAGPDGRRAWVGLRPGDLFHVPGHTPHAFRNTGSEPVVMLVTTTARIGRFFREAGSATGDPLAAFLAAAERYGYWNATPEENAAIGLSLTPVGD